LVPKTSKNSSGLNFKNLSFSTKIDEVSVKKKKPTTVKNKIQQIKPQAFFESKSKLKLDAI
jgi:hypothetical protein